jgi:hypothetical protein
MRQVFYHCATTASRLGRLNWLYKASDFDKLCYILEGMLSLHVLAVVAGHKPLNLG